MQLASKVFVGLEGGVSAGKSTLAEALGAKMGLDVYHEPVKENEYLADFYRDRTQYGFAMQVYLLNARFQQHQEIIWRGRPAIQDRTIWGDTVFAQVLYEEGCLSKRDYDTYLTLFRSMTRFLAHPSVILYLDVDAATAYQRLLLRGRPEEANIPMPYLKALYAAYEGFVQEMARTLPIIRVPWREFRPVDEVAAQVFEELRGVKPRTLRWG